MKRGKPKVEEWTPRWWIPSTRLIGVLGVLVCLLWACGNPAKPTDTPSPPIPSITELGPSSAAAGRTDLSLTIFGTNFARSPSSITWAIWTANGIDTVLRTTVLSSSQLVAVVPAALLRNPGEALVEVTTGNPTSVSADPEHPRSNAVRFEITLQETVPRHPTPDELASLSLTYRVTTTVTQGGTAASCDGRGSGFMESLLISLRVDGNTRVVEADIVRPRTGQTWHLRGTVNDAYRVTASHVAGDSPPGGDAANCAETATVTLTMRFGGPEGDGCQGYSGQIATEYNSIPSTIVEAFVHEPC